MARPGAIYPNKLAKFIGRYVLGSAYYDCNSGLGQGGMEFKNAIPQFSNTPNTLT